MSSIETLFNSIVEKKVSNVSSATINKYCSVRKTNVGEPVGLKIKKPVISNPKPTHFTPRMLEMVRLFIIEDYTLTTIAKEMFVSVKTVEKWLQSAYYLLANNGPHSKLGLARWLVREKIISEKEFLTGVRDNKQ